MPQLLRSAKVWVLSLLIKLYVDEAHKGGTCVLSFPHVQTYISGTC